MNYKKDIKIDRLRKFLGETKYDFSSNVYHSSQQKFTFYKGDINDANLLKKILTIRFL